MNWEDFIFGALVGGGITYLIGLYAMLKDDIEEYFKSKREKRGNHE